MNPNSAYCLQEKNTSEEQLVRAHLTREYGVRRYLSVEPQRRMRLLVARVVAAAADGSGAVKAQQESI